MRYRRAGVAPGGDIDAAEVGRDGGVALRRVGDDLVFTAPAADGMTALLPARSAGADGTRSPLFAELFPARAYAGETAGVRCSAHSISVYDFTTNRLVGVWVGDFAGEGGGAADGPDRLRFRVRADLLPGLADVPWVVVAP